MYGRRRADRELLELMELFSAFEANHMLKGRHFDERIVEQIWQNNYAIYIAERKGYSHVVNDNDWFLQRG